jgi:hypothetical protein
MKTHTLVLSTAKLPIPEAVTIDFVAKLLNRGLTGIEYFGVEIDNPECYISDDMKLASERITYIDFHFDSADSIYYESLSETEVDDLILDLIKKSANIEVRADYKDITVYL